MHYLARLRLLLARRPWLYWLMVSLLASATWAAVHSAVAAAEAQRSTWGSTVTVWVAMDDLEAGARWATATRNVPRAVVPAAAVTAPPTGLVGRDVGRGEIITTADMASTAAPDGWVALAVPATGAPALAPGSTVVLFGNGVLLCEGKVAAAPPAGRSDGEEQVDVFLPPECAALTAANLQAGAVVLGRRG